MEQIGNYMTHGDYYTDMERRFDPDIVTDAECDGDHDCFMCDLYSTCIDRRPIETCNICGRNFTDKDIYHGICKDCLIESIDDETVRGYVSDRDNSDNDMCAALFEIYFSEQEDKCKIGHVSEILKDRLMTQISREFKHDMIFAKYGKCEYHAKEKLIKFIGEDDISWEDFSVWLTETNHFSKNEASWRYQKNFRL